MCKNGTGVRRYWSSKAIQGCSGNTGAHVCKSSTGVNREMCITFVAGIEKVARVQG
jgi:hypothetical protein